MGSTGSKNTPDESNNNITAQPVQDQSDKSFLGSKFGWLFGNKPVQPVEPGQPQEPEKTAGGSKRKKGQSKKNNKNKRKTKKQKSVSN